MSHATLAGEPPKKPFLAPWVMVAWWSFHSASEGIRLAAQWERAWQVVFSSFAIDAFVLLSLLGVIFLPLETFRKVKRIPPPWSRRLALMGVLFGLCGASGVGEFAWVRWGPLGVPSAAITGYMAAVPITLLAALLVRRSRLS